MTTIRTWRKAVKSALLSVALYMNRAACGSAPAAPQTMVQTQVVEVEKQVVATPTSAPAVAEEKFQLTFLNACFPSSQAVTDLMLAAYGAKHPEVDVKVDC